MSINQNDIMKINFLSNNFSSSVPQQKDAAEHKGDVVIVLPSIDTVGIDPMLICDMPDYDASINIQGESEINLFKTPTESSSKCNTFNIFIPYYSYYFIFHLLNINCIYIILIL